MVAELVASVAVLPAIRHTAAGRVALWKENRRRARLGCALFGRDRSLSLAAASRRLVQLFAAVCISSCGRGCLHLEQHRRLRSIPPRVRSAHSLPRPWLRLIEPHPALCHPYSVDSILLALGRRAARVLSPLDCAFCRLPADHSSPADDRSLVSVAVADRTQLAGSQSASRD